MCPVPRVLLATHLALQIRRSIFACSSALHLLLPLLSLSLAFSLVATAAAAVVAAAICVAHVARRGAKFSGKDKARRAGKQAPSLAVQAKRIRHSFRFVLCLGSF